MLITSCLFVVAAVIIALATPKGSAYRAINLVLVGEFSLSFALVGFADLYLYEGVWVFALKLIKDMMFIVIFYHVGGLILSRLQGWIAAYHVALIASLLLSSQVLDDYYFYIMGAFCAAQLLCGLRGASHGIVCSHRYVDSSGVVHRRRHT